MGAAILHLIVAQKQAECGVAGRRVRRRTKNGPDSSRDGCHVAVDVRGRRWGPLENLGDRTSGQGPPTRTCAVNAAAERDRAPVLSRYRRRGRPARRCQTRRRRRLNFHFFFFFYSEKECSPITKSAHRQWSFGSTQQNEPKKKKDWVMCFSSWRTSANPHFNESFHVLY